MVASEKLLGLYIAIPVYFAGMAAIAVWAHYHMKRLEQGGKADALAAHYLGGRGFGPFVTAGTMFASLFSGYTVIGVSSTIFSVVLSIVHSFKRY